MIYTSAILKNKYREYTNINQKIFLESKKGNLIRIKKGLYSDNVSIDGPVIANVCLDPSYISFEYALARYGLIPEFVSVFTSACFGKKNNKTFYSSQAIFEYRNIPTEAYPYGINFFKNEEKITYKIASKEKALCDTLYSKYPVRTFKELETLLFDDLRIDKNEFLTLDFEFISNIYMKYHSNTLLTLYKYIKEKHLDAIDYWANY